MHEHRKAIRALITSMSPRRAKDFIESFGLQKEEQDILIACDVKGMSYQQVADKYHISHEAIKKRKQTAYSKMADEIEYRKVKPLE